ncbi:DUF6114 domain-containing protein [Salinibacillus xinjiangensis]|uniref:Uncharacterized protein n=1 Tax=Salinibacillus xinjiangensis TaxID=1229268 RepID=A0A6G1X5P0_9BACI|nr:DUF6114 domain-containing protein [Salinibacillus xinjiangensis]MRG86284.1 hypothetical protein [Salinibacillus xinjiangensis]
MKFRRWRRSRPFWGSLITTFAGLTILWVPLNLVLSAFLPGSMAVIGILFGGLIILLGLLGFFFPQFSTIIGILTIFLSILSIIGALGGFIFGTIFGLIGGAMSIAWRTIDPNEEQNKKAKRKTNTPEAQEDPPASASQTV